ncbi:Hypothetical predicted protein [Paramuricea clavata]|uniref:Uncharacterized protein n=1 Tax=Paramuricea clavata TaxID=317549 RepID=A0A7D9DXX6_PARCT|nr:Hypothetical predicted protein [Paramuricea clavata]
MGNFRQVNILVVLAGISAILPGQLALPEHPITSGHDSVFSIVEEYFKRNLSYSEMLDLLFLYHGIAWSLDQLKYVLKKLNLRRYNTQSTDKEVGSAILAELNGPGCQKKQLELIAERTWPRNG